MNEELEVLEAMLRSAVSQLDEPMTMQDMNTLTQEVLGLEEQIVYLKRNRR